MTVLHELVTKGIQLPVTWNDAYFPVGIVRQPWPYERGILLPLSDPYSSEGGDDSRPANELSITRRT